MPELGQTLMFCDRVPLTSECSRNGQLLRTSSIILLAVGLTILN